MPRKPLPTDDMPWNRDKVWCLGTKIEGYTYVPWEKSGISFSNCDVLIVDVRSLSTYHMLTTAPSVLITLKREIDKRSQFKDFTLVCILADKERLGTETQTRSTISAPWLPYHSLQPRKQDRASILRQADIDLSNYFWFPDSIEADKLPSGVTGLTDEWKANPLCRFEKYFEEIKSYKTGISIQIESDRAARTKSGDLVAYMYRRRPLGAAMILLPPLQTSEKSVSMILEILSQGGSAFEPEWSKRIEVPGAGHIKQTMDALEVEIEEKRKQIKIHELDLAEKRSFTKLLYETGFELEKAVMDALRMLGLSVKQVDTGEDLILLPLIDTPYKLCSIEIKGVKNKIKRADLRQLDEYVDCQRSKGTKSKGILVANMHRLCDIQTSKTDRSKLDPDQLAFAEDMEFCIVPTHVLFDLCIRSMSGHGIDQRELEKVLISTSGFVKLEDLIKSSAQPP